MRYFIALDVGGTKSDAVLFNEFGDIVAHTVGAGGTAVDLGVSAAEHNYLDVVKKLTAGFSGEIDCLYASIAIVGYYGNEFQNFMRSNLDYRVVRIEEDGPCLISGVLGPGDGCSIICGTGSAFYIRRDGKYHHLGGGGYLIDSPGSGYVLGKLALRAGFRAKEGWEEKTLLVELLEKQCGETLLEHYTKIYSSDRSHIASFANTVFEARDMGDRVASRIFNFCAGELADLISAGYREIGGPFDLVYNGGIFYNRREYAEAVRALAPSCITSYFSDVKPIYGCAVEAMHDAGLTCSDEFKRRFLSSYKS